MSMKNKSNLSKEIGAELVKRTKNLNENIESIMGKVANPKETFNIVDDEVTLTLSRSNNQKQELFSVDFSDNFLHEYFEMNLSRETIREMAEFMFNYLENN